MPTRFSTNIRNNSMQGIVNDAGANAKVMLYNGSQPSVLGGAPAGTLLAQGTGAAVLGTVAGGVLTFNAVTGDSSGDASGTPTWCRITTSADVVVADFVATGNVADVVAGEPYNFSSITITEGNP